MQALLIYEVPLNLAWGWKVKESKFIESSEFISATCCNLFFPCVGALKAALCFVTFFSVDLGSCFPILSAWTEQDKMYLLCKVRMLDDAHESRVVMERTYRLKIHSPGNIRRCVYWYRKKAARGTSAFPFFLNVKSVRCFFTFTWTRFLDSFLGRAALRPVHTSDELTDGINS